LRLFSFGGYGLALAALALVVFGAYDSYPQDVEISIFYIFTQPASVVVRREEGAKSRNNPHSDFANVQFIGALA